jgi:hypothetical protein
MVYGTGRDARNHPGLYVVGNSGYFSAVHLTQQIFTAVTAICIVLFALICMGGGAAPILWNQMIKEFTAERTNPNG